MTNLPADAWRPAPEEAASRPFRVMAYNLDFGGAGREEAIYAVIAGVSPDVVALTEADDPAIVAGLAARLGMHHVWERGSGERHVALLSRHPIRESRVYNRRPITQAVLETRIEIPSLHSSTSNPQSLIPNLLTLYTAHLLPYLLLPFEVRRAQAMHALLKIIARDQPGPHLILGDLNAIAPGDRVLQHKNPARMRRVMALQANIIFRLAIPVLLRAGYVDCFRACQPNGSGPRPDGFTWHTGARTTRYDYIFADRRLAPGLRACRVIDDLPAIETASDHYPIVADFDLAALQL